MNDAAAVRSKVGGEGSRSLESVIAASRGEDAAELARPWPIHGKAAGAYDERHYQDVCRGTAVTSHVLCRREDLMRCSDGEFVAAAFTVIAGHAPDRSIWKYHCNRLASGEATRDDIITELQSSPAGQGRNVVIFEQGQLRPLAEITGVSSKDLTKVLLGLVRSRAGRRFSFALDRLLRTHRRR